MAIEHRILRRDGAIRWVSARKKIQFEPDIDGVPRAVRGIFVMQDITERKFADERVRISEARYRTVVEGSQQGIVIQQNSRILYANPSMARIFGYASPREMIGLSTFDDLVVQDDQPVLRNRIAAVYKGEAVGPHPGWRGKHKAGNVLWVSSTAHITEWDGQPAVTSFYYDVTKEKLAHDRQVESEIAYRNALRAARSGAFEWNIVTDKVTWSRETGDLLKVKPENYPKTLEEFLQFVPENERAAMSSGIANRLASDSNDYEIENQLLRSDGTIQWVRGSGSIERDAGGKPLRLVGLVSDIGELRKTRDALKISEARLRRIMDNVLAFVATLTPDGMLTEVNATGINITGLTREDFVGRAFWDCHWWAYSADVQQRVRMAIQRAALGETVRYDESIKIANDSMITIDFQIAPVFNESGNISELVTSAVDVTERKRGEHRIRLLMREVNHRSKNLLTVVQAIARQTARDSDVATFVTRLSDRISGLAASQDLLVKSDWRGADLTELVESQLGHFKDLFGKRIRFEGSPLRLTPVGSQAMGMALHELGTNASKYGALSNDKGKVLIKWGCESKPEPMFNIAWQEYGGPPVDQPTRRGFGQRVIGPMIEASVFGRATIEYSKNGLNWKLSAPINKILEID